MDTHPVSRRKFCKTAAGASFGLTIASVLNDAHAVFGSVNGLTIDLSLSANSALTKIGGAMYVTLPAIKDTLIVVRNSNTEVSAFTSVCTHAGCQVDLPVNGVAVCRCHDSRFSDNGQLLKGPAKLPLKRYSAQLQGNFIYIDSTEVGVMKNPATLFAKSPEITWYKEREMLVLSRDNRNPGIQIVSLFTIQGQRISRNIWEDSGDLSIPTKKLPRGEYILQVELTGANPIVRNVLIN